MGDDADVRRRAHHTDTVLQMPLQPKTMLRNRLLVLATFAAALGCGNSSEAPKAPAAAQPEDRERKAMSLHTRSAAAPVDEKVTMLRRIVGVYGDTKIAPRAYYELVFYLLQCEPAAFEEAFAASKSFAERFPTEPLVTEAFHRVHDACHFGGREELVKSVREAWGTWLSEHDAANDVSKAVLLPDLFTLRVLEERWAEAKVAIDAAVDAPDLPRHKRAELLHRKGDLLAHFLGDPITACVVLRESLGICNDLEGLRVPMRHDREGVLESLVFAASEALGLFVTASRDSDSAPR